MRKVFTTMVATCGLMVAASPVNAEIDGHGPDAWRVTGVAADDVLNMRMGPGTNYLVIDRLAPDARGLQQVTCVPLLIQPYYGALTDAQRNALPQRWCLMRSADLSKSGWVAQRYLQEDGQQDVFDPSADADGETQADAITRLADSYLGGYTKVDVSEVMGRIEAGLRPSQSAWVSYSDIQPLAMAILALEAVDGARDRVRYRIRLGIEALDNPPKGYMLPVSFVQVDRFSLGAAIRNQEVAAHGADAVAPPEGFDAGPHVSWRLVASPVQGISTNIHEMARVELSEAEAAEMSCLNSPCLDIGMNIEEAAPWDAAETTAADLDPAYEAYRDRLLTPAAAIEQLLGAEYSFNTERFREPPEVPQPFLEAVIEVNLAQDSVLDTAVRIGDTMDDSIAAEWKRLLVMPSDGGASAPLLSRFSTYECYRGDDLFPAPGGLCP